MERFIFFISFLFLPFAGICENNLSFYNVNDIYGVSIRETTSICKDSDGFIWIASKTGMVRLTDSDCRIYQLPYESMAVISVEVMYQEKQLFAFTNQGEIFKYNDRLDQFERYLNLPRQINVTNLWLFDLEISSDGSLWIASSSGLYYRKENQCTKMAGVTSSVKDMIRYDDNHLIAAGSDGIYYINTKSKEVNLWKENMGISPASLMLDSAMNRLWIGTMSDGLYSFDYATKELCATPIENFPQQCVKDIELVSDSTIWCGIDGRGVWVLSRDGKRMIQIYQEEPDNPLSIRGNGVYDLCYESPGRIWVCSITGGVSVAEIASPMVTQLQHHINNPNSLVNNYVHDLIEDRQGRLWIGTNSGLSCWNPHTGKWINYFEERNSEAFIILALCEDSEGNIWVGSYAHGIYVIDGKLLKIIAHYTRQVGILSKTGFVFDILKDKNDDMWIAGTNGEIIKYDRQTQEFISYPVASVYDMAEWGDHTLLLGCSHGLLALDKNTKKLTTLLTDNMIRDIAIVQDKIWISSEGGLFSYNIRTNASEKYDTHNGVISNNLNSILHINGYLWLGTDNGLCRFDMIDKTITTYTSPIVISKVSYNQSAGFRLRNGMLAWGTNNGVIILDPNVLNDQKTTGRIYIQDLLLSGLSIREYPGLLPEVPLDKINDITLSYKQNNITLNVLPLGDNSRTARLSWKMQGLDDEWSNLTNQRIINYTNLNPGSYGLSIRLYNHNLISERTLIIRINPPFWATWWFRLACILLTSWLLYFLFRFYINHLNQQHAKDKLRFFTNTVHDLRTALTLIKAPIEELNQSNSLSEHDRKYLLLALEQTQRLTSVATQLMNFQKADMGKEQFHPVMSDIIALTGSRVSMFESIAATKQIKIAYYHDKNNYLTAIDSDMMERVIDNLLSNAVKYSHEQSVVEVHLHGDERQWRLAVVDYGIGLSHKAQGKLFHEFYRSENAINAKIIGSGIGLFTTKMLVELHGGKIGVESEEGKGSTFEIIVPRCKNEIYEKAPDKQVSVPQDDTAGGFTAEDMHILIVEDNYDLRNFMLQSLGSHFQVVTTVDGVEAWEYIRQEIPDLIVSDIMMPRMDGFELCRLVKSSFETSHIPVILLTALSEKTNELHGLGIGADNYITKPFDMKTLIQQIASIIRNRRSIGSRFISMDTVVEMENKLEEPANKLNDAFVKLAIEVVVRHLDDSDFGKDEFAKEMGVSTSLLFKKMKALTGTSVVDFIRDIRMEHAMIFIREKKYSISEIAYKCGFSSVGYFDTIFKKHFGKSPTSYIS